MMIDELCAASLNSGFVSLGLGASPADLIGVPLDGRLGPWRTLGDTYLTLVLSSLPPLHRVRKKSS
jgi:hypothetical protein